jgi:ribonuclease BN (tRNA processing enzyme)
MYVQCLGSGDAFGSRGKLNTCYLVRSNDKCILLDCGATALVALKKQGLSSLDVDIIVVSHLHGDHIGGIPFIVTERQVKGDVHHRLVIIGPTETEERVMKLLKYSFDGIGENIRFPLQFIEYGTGETFQYEQLTITTFAAVHAPTTNPHSLRLELGGKVIAFSGDTEWSENLVDVACDADLFICEGYAYDEPVGHHMSIKELLHNLPRLTAKQIVLTHLSEEALNSAPKIPIKIAEDGEVLFEFKVEHEWIGAAQKK